jgi:hypothetical protein
MNCRALIHTGAPHGNAVVFRCAHRVRIALIPLVIALILLPFALTLAHARPAQPAAPAQGTRFIPVDIYIDSHDQPLAVYEFELVVKTGDAKIVGIEGGAPAVFKDPPYYDPKALNNNHIIIAAFSTAPAAELPKGRTRVARLMMQITGAKPEFTIALRAAGDANGTRMNATAEVVQGDAP